MFAIFSFSSLSMRSSLTIGSSSTTVVSPTLIYLSNQPVRLSDLPISLSCSTGDLIIPGFLLDWLSFFPIHVDKPQSSTRSATPVGRITTRPDGLCRKSVNKFFHGFCYFTGAGGKERDGFYLFIFLAAFLMRKYQACSQWCFKKNIIKK